MWRPTNTFFLTSPQVIGSIRLSEVSTGSHFRGCNSEEYREAFQARVASFELRYPILVRRGFVALMVVPLALQDLD